MASSIFTDFRNVGCVCNHIPLQIRYITRRKENLIVTAVGNVFHTYSASKLRLISVSNPCPDEITFIAVDKYSVYTVSTNKIQAWVRGRELKYTLTDDENVVYILILGPNLVSVNEKNILKLWDLKTKEKSLELNFDENFKITCIVHPSTYVNKILLGSKQGKLQLWNINTCSLIYTFKGWKSAVCTLEQSPAIDVVAIGLENGKIYLHNLKYDENLMKFSQQNGPVTAISFRTDGPAIMATGSTLGQITLWNLEEKKISSQIPRAHNSSICGLTFFPNEPVLITNSSDNSIKMWTFDDDVGRLLKSREGHSAPPSRIRFHDIGSILSGSQDSIVHVFSTVNDMLHRKLGTATLKRKSKGSANDDDVVLPPIVDLTSATIREREWSNAVTAHLGHSEIETWSTHLGKKTGNKLVHQRFRGKSNVCATALCITCCGNFVLIGYNTGHVDVFNIQSSIYRGSFSDPAHKKSIGGVVSDSLNNYVVTGSQDCLLKKWGFKSKNMIKDLNIESPVLQLVLHRDSGLLAVVTGDFDIKIVDIDTWKLLRIYEGHLNRITDVCFSPDAKWLISSSMDSSIRTWDLITGCLVDLFEVESPCTSLTISPVGDFLATAHVAQLGIQLWVNKTLYEPITLKKITEDEEMADLEEEEFSSPEQISQDLITLSTLPQSRWKNLLLLDVIKERNKPKEPPKTPKKAPFFLPTIPGLNLQFDVSADDENTKEKSSEKFIFENFGDLSSFEKLLQQDEKAEVVIEKLKSFGPSAIDYELRSLSETSCKMFLQVINESLEKNIDFEVIQSYLGLFLKIHWDSISKQDDCLEILEDIEKYEKENWTRIQKRFFQNLTLVNFLKNVSL